MSTKRNKILIINGFTFLIGTIIGIFIGIYIRGYVSPFSVAWILLVVAFIYSIWGIYYEEDYQQVA